MALNLGPQAYEAITRLKNNSDWRIFVASLEEQTSNLMHQAIEGPVEQRVDATGYARGARDILGHIVLVERAAQGGRPPRTTVKTSPAHLQASLNV